jgi:hypothetical protein
VLGRIYQETVTINASQSTLVMILDRVSSVRLQTANLRDKKNIELRWWCMNVSNGSSKKIRRRLEDMGQGFRHGSLWYGRRLTSKRWALLPVLGWWTSYEDSRGNLTIQT